MCERAVEEDLCVLKFVRDQYKTRQMCRKAVEKDLNPLEFVPLELVIQEMCNESVKKCPWSLIHAPDLYVRLQEMWCEDYSHVVRLEPWIMMISLLSGIVAMKNARH